MSLYIPSAFVYRTDAMRQIIRLLQSNSFYTQGKFELKHAPIFAAQHEAYGAFIDEQTRYRWRKKGIASVQAVYLLDKENERVFYWIFVSEGVGLVHDFEQLKPTTGKKTRVRFAGYEAVRVTKKNEDGLTWTWQLTTDKLKELEDNITIAIRHKDFETIRQWGYSLKRSMGFSGVRKQAYKLAKNAENEWKRTARGKFPAGDFFIGWLGQFKKAKLAPLYKSSLGKHISALYQTE